MLYNPEDLKKEIRSLEQKHGQDKVTRAIQTAAIVFEENNLKTIEVLIDLEDQYGQTVIQQAAQKIAQKNPDNPKRSAGYLINTIKSMGDAKIPAPACPPTVSFSSVLLLRGRVVE